MPNVLNYEVRKLDNGLKCIYVPMDTPGSACSNIVYNIGSANERAGEYGLAHLLEHGMHFGSPKFSANTKGGLITDMELKAALENATTSFYRTNYFLTVPVQFIPDVILREADRMNGLDTKIFLKRLLAEVTVVLNEMEIGQNSPMRAMLTQLHSIAFNQQPNGHSTIGLRKHLEATVKNKGENLLAFHRRSYTPDNATLVLAGPFNENTITVNALHDKVQSAFGNISASCSDKNNYETEPQQTGMRSFTMPGETTICVMGFRTPPGTHKDSIALKALSQCIKYRMKELEQHHICSQSEVMFDRSRQSSLFTIWTVGFTNPELVRTSVEKVISDIKSYRGVAHDELQKAKDELSIMWKSQLTSAQGVADAFTEAVAIGYPNDVNTKFESLANLEPHDLAVAAQNWLIDTGLTVGLMYPYNVPSQVETPQILPALSSTSTENLVGNVLTLPRRLAKFSFDGTEHYASGDIKSSSLVTSGTFWKRPGLVHVSVTYTPKVDTEWFAMALGSVVESHVSWSQAGLGTVRAVITTTPDKLNKLMLDSIWGERKNYSNAGERGKMMQKSLMYDVNMYAVKLMREALFDVPSFNHTLKDAVEIVKQSPRRVVAVAPNYDSLNIIRDYFQHDAKYEEFVPEAKAKPKLCNIVEQNKTSIKVLYGQALPTFLTRSHKDYVPLTIATAILGYGFHGLLTRRVRMQSGLTYSIESHIQPGLFQVGATFPPRNLQKGLTDIQAVLARWRSEISPKEVGLQKQRLKLMPITLSDSAEMYVKAQHTFLNEDLINSCSHSDVLAAFDKYINIHNLTHIRVG